MTLHFLSVGVPILLSILKHIQLKRCCETLLFNPYWIHIFIGITVGYGYTVATGLKWKMNGMLP